MSHLSYPFFYGSWIALAVLTAGLSFLPGAQGAALTAQRLAAIAYFIPAVLIVLKARQSGAFVHTKRIRRLAIVWLALALVLLCLNIASVLFSELVGNVLYAVMAVVCAPVACGEFYGIPVFCWAVLLFASKSKPLRVNTK